jgi:oxalate decarboxylase/phosphoglucose isomerase-like protein (cupin superfamily)
MLKGTRSGIGSARDERILRLFPAGGDDEGRVIREAYVVRIPAGSQRAGHWHRVKREWVVALHGTVEARLAAPPGSDAVVHRMRALTDALVVPPNTEHLFRNLARTPADLLVLSDRPRGRRGKVPTDTFRTRR